MISNSEIAENLYRFAAQMRILRKRDSDLVEDLAARIKELPYSLSEKYKADSRFPPEFDPDDLLDRELYDYVVIAIERGNPAEAYYWDINRPKTHRLLGGKRHVGPSRLADKIKRDRN